ncbi:MAG: hypothetical protein CL567_03685 [Alphaproteobacteria bacterium]|nr:hypothetical protein [Alphaproteobacteria bacterium]
MKNKLFLILALLIFLIPTLSHADKLITCKGNDHIYWTKCFGILRAGFSGTYYGEFLDGKKHGKGTEVRFDGSKYVGKWVKGKLIKISD